MSTRVTADALRTYLAALLSGAGYPARDAADCAKVLVWADLRGQSGHGAARAPSYIMMARKGIVDPRAQIDVRVIKGGVAHVNAHRALGAAALLRGAATAIDRARDAATAWVLVQDHGHAGAIGYYAREIAQAGMLAIVMTASRPMMVYHGTRTPALATSPIAIALPGGALLDMSTASIAMGKIDAAKEAGRELPPGVAVDEAGEPTTDPAAAVAPLPIGGPKGAGLALMIEALTSVALANPLVASALRDASQMEDYRLNTLMIALDLAILGGAEAFNGRFAELEQAIKAEPRAKGFDAVYMPGERGDLASARREREGIEVGAATWARLAQFAGEFGVALPASR